MINIRSFLTVSALALLAGCNASTAEAPLPPTAFQMKMDAMLSTAVESGEVLGVQALVFDDGETIYRGMYGVADRERNLPVAEDTVYRVYSMTKPMTSALIMDLIEEGKLALDDPASKYVPQLANMKVASLDENGAPQYAEQARPMTIEDLLLHRAGLAYGIFGQGPIEQAYQKAGLFNSEETMADQMDKLGALPLLGQPGEQWFYSFSIDVLGRIAEVVTDQTLGEALQERFLGPLGMTETAFQVRPDQKPRFASNYLLQEDGSYVLADDAQTSDFTLGHKYESGGGGLASTTDDWLKFARMLLNEGEYEGVRILEPETVRLMMTDHLGDTPSLLPWVGSGTSAGFGYGGAVELRASEAEQAERGTYPGQFGWGGAARTNFWVDPENDAVGIIMLQFFGGDDPAIHDRFQALALSETRDDK